MLAPTRRPARRSAAAAVEMAVVLNFVLIPVMIGTWEIGRLIHVTQIVANGTREGCRMASQAVTIREDGAPIQIKTAVTPPASTSTPGEPNVKAAVVQTIYGSGLKSLRWADVGVTFEFLDFPNGGSAATVTEPYQGVTGQRFRIATTIPWDKVKWSGLGFVNPTNVTYAAEWRILVDATFSLNTTIPGNNPPR